MRKYPYRFFLLGAIILIILSFFTIKETFDIHLHDTYFVLDSKMLWRLLAAVLFLYWGIYKLTNKFLFSLYLTWLHVILTLIPIIVLASGPYWLNNSEMPGTNDYIKPAEQPLKNYKTIAAVTRILLIGQLSYIVNLVAGVTKLSGRTQKMT